MAFKVRRRIWNGGTQVSNTKLGNYSTQCGAEERMLREVGVDLIAPSGGGLGYKYVCGSLETQGFSGCRTQDPDSDLAREYDVVEV
ncbi:MAG: hypothetical protein H6526_09010 [Actinobacteria bacterium]|nr:hypothetical protein [Actinomycetota bacterium]